MSCRWCNSTGKECGCGLGYCDHCGGSGNVEPPPFGDGSTTKLEAETISYLAKAATDMRCCGSEGMIQAVAYYAAKVTLTPKSVQKYVDYWKAFYRDASLGDFIRQIAEHAESLAH